MERPRRFSAGLSPGARESAHGALLHHRRADLRKRRLAIRPRGVASHVPHRRTQRACRVVPFQTRIEDVYRALDVVVHASTRPEPFGRTIVEAMATGRPVVACREGGATELFTDGSDAVGVPPRNEEALANAIVALVSDSERRRAIGAAARESAVLRFCRPRLAGQVLRLYADAGCSDAAVCLDQPRAEPHASETHSATNKILLRNRFRSCYEHFSEGSHGRKTRVWPPPGSGCVHHPPGVRTRPYRPRSSADSIGIWYESQAFRITYGCIPKYPRSHDPHTQRHMRPTVEQTVGQPMGAKRIVGIRFSA